MDTYLAVCKQTYIFVFKRKMLDVLFKLYKLETDLNKNTKAYVFVSLFSID